MPNVNTEGLPPEMQARLAQIIEGAKQQAVQPQPPAPVSTKPEVRQPSLMDHCIAMRQEIAALRQETAALSQQMNAVAQVVDACGQAVGQLYQMFQPSPELPHQSAQTGPTYSDTFQQQAVNNNEDF